MSRLKKKPLGAIPSTQQEVSHFEFLVTFSCVLHVSQGSYFKAEVGNFFRNL